MKTLEDRYNKHLVKQYKKSGGKIHKVKPVEPQEVGRMVRPKNHTFFSF